jgi:hypothetical protein
VFRWREETVSWRASEARLADTHTSLPERDVVMRLQVPIEPGGRTRNLMLQLDARDEDSLLAALSGRAPVGSAAPPAFS